MARYKFRLIYTDKETYNPNILKLSCNILCRICHRLQHISSIHNIHIIHSFA